MLEICKLIKFMSKQSMGDVPMGLAAAAGAVRACRRIGAYMLLCG
jgi:hypothetical protein